MTVVGRWAPSPTGDFHIGNLRTALLAWLFARSAGGRFLWRFEDLDITSKAEFRLTQQRDMNLIGLDWDGEPISQSDRLELYAARLSELIDAGYTYDCYCSRREIREAAAAPHDHLPEGAYRGTCRHLTAAQIAERQKSGRPPALRLAAHAVEETVFDRQLGEFTGVVDDVVLRRGDGTPAYNFVVVVDDDDQGINQVVRADDLLASTPRQVHLAHLLKATVPEYAHVPMVLDGEQRRLAKRWGAVTLSDRIALGEKPITVLNALLSSLDLPQLGRVSELATVLGVFDAVALPRTPFIYEP